jgi:hypothetical protein
MTSSRQIQGSEPSGPSESYLDYHRRVSSNKISTASAYARRITDSNSARSGTRITTSLEAITGSLQLSTVVAGSYVDDSKALFEIARKLVDRVTAIEKVLGRSTEVPTLRDGVQVTSAVRNRYVADVMQAAIYSLEGCLEGYTLVTDQQTQAMRSILLLKESSEDFQTQIGQDMQIPTKKVPDEKVTTLVTNYMESAKRSTEIAELLKGPKTKPALVKEPTLPIEEEKDDAELTDCIDEGDISQEEEEGITEET